MGSDMKFQALRRRSAPWVVFGPLAHCQRWRPWHAAWCSAFFLLASGAAQAQCPATLTTASLATPPAQQDLRDTVIAHRDGECGVQTVVARRLSRSELEELRRAVREHGIRMQQMADSGAERADLTDHFTTVRDELAELWRRAEAAAQPGWDQP